MKEIWIEKNKDILEGKFLTLSVIFHEDNDLNHTAEATLQWLKEDQSNVLEWLGQNPELYQTEILWYDLTIAAHEPHPYNVNELGQFKPDKYKI